MTFHVLHKIHVHSLFVSNINADGLLETLWISVLCLKVPATVNPSSCKMSLHGCTVIRERAAASDDCVF